jgi:type IV secretory pathway VirB10-like protein
MSRNTTTKALGMWVIAGIVIAAGAQIAWTHYIENNKGSDAEKFLSKLQNTGKSVAQNVIKKVTKPPVSAPAMKKAPTEIKKPVPIKETAQIKKAAPVPAMTPAPAAKKEAVIETPPAREIAQEKAASRQEAAAAAEQETEEQFVERMGRVADMLENKSAPEETASRRVRYGRRSGRELKVAKKDEDSVMERQINIVSDLMGE